MAKKKTPQQEREQKQKQKQNKQAQNQNKDKPQNQKQQQNKPQKQQQPNQKQPTQNNANQNKEKPKGPRNKQRTLVLSTRGITTVHRHLSKDWRRLLPHHKKESKLDAKDQLKIVNEICEMKSCNNCLLFESRKKQDLFLWVSKSPNGPSAKFHVLNVYTMAELKLTGNALHGSRPILFFDPQFEQTEQMRLLKELFVQALGTPKGHPKSKPFIDHVFSFSVIDDKIWFRNYQLLEREEGGRRETTLVEIGPRMVLNLVRIFEGSFGGPTLYENPNFISPNLARAMAYKKKANKYVNRVVQQNERKEKLKKSVLPSDPLLEVFK